MELSQNRADKTVAFTFCGSSVFVSFLSHEIFLK